MKTGRRRKKNMSTKQNFSGSGLFRHSETASAVYWIAGSREVVALSGVPILIYFSAPSQGLIALYWIRG